MENRRPENPIVYRQTQFKGRRIEDLYWNIAGEANSSLLLSGGNLDSARFSFIGNDPFCIIRSKDSRTEIIRSGSRERFEGDPFTHLESILNRYQVAPPPADLPFTAGGIGFFAYELKNYLEKLPQTAQDDLSLPELYFCFYRQILIHDRQGDSWYLSCYVPTGDADDHKERMDAFIRRLNSVSRMPSASARENGRLVSNFTKKEYLETVKKIQRYIIDGHIYQANVSQRFSIPFSGDPYESLIKMFQLNPASFYAFLNGGDFQVLSTSPERFLFQNRDYVETRPIKGTRPRGKTQKIDVQLRNELKESFKDSAELSMIVDVLRNDISKVCQGGTVTVKKHKEIEAYNNVFHLLSVITGRLRNDRSRLDLFKACFPGGSITGCPKIRSMEIIDEIEPHARSVYAGSIGYLSFHNSMDLNIAIRTAIVKNDFLHFNVGGGIVYDSNPEDEYRETLYKGESVLKSLGHLREAIGMG